jgi:hypothetical protein
MTLILLLRRKKVKAVNVASEETHVSMSGVRKK